MEELLRIARVPAVSASPDATVHELCEQMIKEAVGAVVILDGGKLVGIFSERDVVGRVVLPGLDAKTTRVSEVMTRKVSAAQAGMSVDNAMEVMHRGRFRHLPLVNETGQVVGMLSVRHLLRHRVDQLDMRNADLIAYISADGPGG